MALRHGHSINTCELRSKHFICDVSTESSQSSGTTSSQMLQWPPHLAWSPIRIIRPHRQIQSWCSSVQHPLHLLCFWRWISSWPFLEVLKIVDVLEPPSLITSLMPPACLWPIHFLWHKVICSGGQSLRPQKLRVPDWLTEAWLFCS